MKKPTISSSNSDVRSKRIVGRPFLRWAGGKRRIVRHLLRFLPTEPFKAYWEPFLGAGALFFAIAPSKGHLSDYNSELISCYRAIQEKPELVYRYLRDHLSRTSKEYYYQTRDQYNRSRASAAQAARFIYLNRTGFNGIYRVNQRGQYNVPYGHKEPAPAPSRDDLLHASKLLGNASLSDDSFDVALSHNALRARDLVYLDPPYPPRNRTSNFTHYTAPRFSWEDQERVAQLASRIRDKGCFVMISNSDVEPIRDLFSDSKWHIHRLPVIRWIAANGSRQEVGEVVITSYAVIPPRKLGERD